MPGNIAPLADLQRKLGIAAGAHHEFAKAVVRNPGTGVFGNGVNDNGLTAIDEYFGDHFADGQTLRNRLKVTLALA